MIIQRIYGGQFSNRTKRRILRQAALIGVYKAIRISLESMFALNHRTYRHSPPKMEKTLQRLCAYMQQKGTHLIQPGPRHKSAYSIPDMIDQGLLKLQGVAGGADMAEAGDTEAEIIADGEDGDLDIVDM